MSQEKQGSSENGLDHPDGEGPSELSALNTLASISQSAWKYNFSHAGCYIVFLFSPAWRPGMTLQSTIDHRTVGDTEVPIAITVSDIPLPSHKLEVLKQVIPDCPKPTPTPAPQEPTPTSSPPSSPGPRTPEQDANEGESEEIDFDYPPGDSAWNKSMGGKEVEAFSKKKHGCKYIRKYMPTAEEHAYMEQFYKKNHFPDHTAKEVIAEGIKWPVDRVANWFNNRRARDRRHDLVKNAKPEEFIHYKPYYRRLKTQKFIT